MSLRSLMTTAAVAATLVLAPGAHAATIQTTPSTLSGAFDAAQAGDTIVLAPGDYGTFTGGMKSGAVTLKAAAGATPTIRLEFSPATNVTIDGLRIADAYFADARTKHITVRNSDIPGQTIFRTGELANADILFDNNVHRDWDKCSNCAEGRVWLPERTAQPSGITIQNSQFRGGLSDGIQNGSNGTRIIGNTFHRIERGSGDGVHADAIQLYGSRSTLIKGNWFHDLPNGVGVIMSPDGADHEVIEDNVFGPANGRPFTIDLGSDDGSVVRHNTFVDGACEFNLRCGILSLGYKSGDDPGVGTVVQDNILSEVSTGGSGGVSFTSRFNLLAHQNPIGPGDQRGAPIYVGGASPSTYAGFALAAGSPGKASASDGLDRGARITGAAPDPGPDPAPDPGPDPEPDPGPDPGPAPDASAQAIWTAPSGATVGTPVTLNGSGSKGDGPLACTWSFENADGSTIWDTANGCTLSKAFTSVGAKYVKLTVTDADGDTDADKQSFAVAARDADPQSGSQPAVARWDTPDQPRVGQQVTLDGTRSTGDGTLVCSWSFQNADGSLVYATATGCETSRRFRSAGIKRVRLTVEDRDGDTDSETKSFTVTG